MTVTASSNTGTPGPDGGPGPADNTAPPPVPTSTDQLHRPPSEPAPPATGRRRRWPIAVAGGLLVAGAVGGYALVADGTATTDEAEPVTIRAVTAEQRDLVSYTDLDGTLGYAQTQSVSAAIDSGRSGNATDAATGATSGTITAVVTDGDTVARGDTIYEIDAVPVVALYGDIPLYRSLTEGDEGDDVELLEANLASLGYHLDQDEEELQDGADEVDTGFVVDGVFDAATTAAVRRWQADLGLEETGRLDLGDVVVIEGPAIASGLRVELGSVVQDGAPILDLNVTASVEALYSAHTGELQLEATSGPITTGRVLYVVDGRPITAIVTDEPFDRALSEGVDDGDDVRLVEEMLVSLGYDARGDLVPDGEFDDVTTEAVEDWEEDLQDTWEDVVIDGVVSLDEILVVEPGTTVGTVTGRESDVVAAGSELFTWSTGDGGRIVTTAIDVAEQDKLTEGADVDVELPDGSIVVGTVAEVATSSTTDPTDPEAEPQLAVEIALSSVPDSVAGLNELDVEVKLVEELAAGATVVPASALVATADGGYAVEVVDGTATNYVAVDPGMFADGFVEVTGIQPGTAVVVPS